MLYCITNSSRLAVKAVYGVSNLHARMHLGSTLVRTPGTMVQQSEQYGCSAPHQPPSKLHDTSLVWLMGAAKKQDSIYYAQILLT